MTEHDRSSGSGFLRAVGRVLRFLLRLFLILAIGAVVGLGLFYGIPWVYRRLIWPVQENSAQIALLRDQVDKNSGNIFDNNRALEERLMTLEDDVAELHERTAAQSEDQEALRQESQQLAERITALQGDLKGQQQEMEQDIEQVRSDFSGTRSDLEQKIGEMEDQLDETQRQLREKVETSEENLADLEGEVDQVTARLALLQTAQALSKTRLLLVEENPGAARDTLGLAVIHLKRASELLPSQADSFSNLREQMLEVDGLIAEDSFRVRPTLEALWADVMDLAMPLTARSIMTETQGTSPLPTPTPSP